MKKIFLSFLISFFLFTPSFSQIDSIESYYPLQIGNLWQYYVKHVFMFDTTYSYKFTSVLSDTLLGSPPNSYYVVQVAFSGKPFAGDTIKYLRYDGTVHSVVEFDNSFGMGESILFKLDADENDCWDYFYIDVCCTQIDTTLIFGQSKMSKSFSTQDYTPPNWGYSLAKDLGPVSIGDDQSWGFVVWTSYSLVYAKINGIEYGILEVDDGENDVKKYWLSQNYPNPFNPVTTITYQIPKTGFVTIKVYDILGREVATLVNEEKPAGSYEVQFNSHSGEGRNLTSGIYFYQIKAGDYSETKKMILLR